MAFGVGFEDHLFKALAFRSAAVARRHVGGIGEAVEEVFPVEGFGIGFGRMTAGRVPGPPSWHQAMGWS